MRRTMPAGHKNKGRVKEHVGPAMYRHRKIRGNPH